MAPATSTIPHISPWRGPGRSSPISSPTPTISSSPADWPVTGSPGRGTMSQHRGRDGETRRLRRLHLDRQLAPSAALRFHLTHWSAIARRHLGARGGNLCDCFDLDEQFGPHEFFDHHDGAGRCILLEIFCAHFVQDAIVRGVHKVRRGADDIIEATACRAQDVLEVFVHLAALLLDVGWDAAVPPPPNGSGDEDEVAATDPERVRSDGLRYRAGLHDLLAHASSSLLDHLIRPPRPRL